MAAGHSKQPQPVAHLGMAEASARSVPVLGAAGRCRAEQSPPGSVWCQLAFALRGPALRGTGGLGWHLLSCQAVSHYFLWPSSPTGCFLQLRYPIYQLETGTQAQFPPAPPGGLVAPAPDAGVLGPSLAPLQPGPASQPVLLQTPTPAALLPLPGSRPHHRHPRQPASHAPPSWCRSLGRLLTFCWTSRGEKVSQC